MNENKINEYLNYLETHSYSDTSKHFGISKSSLERYARLNNRVYSTRKIKRNNNISSKIYLEDISHIQEVLLKSTSISNALVLLGYSSRKHYRDHLLKIINNNNLDVSKFEINTNNNLKVNIVDKSYGMCLNSTLNRTTLRDKFIKYYAEYRCCICGNEGIHLGNKLVLQVDHINGINNDNRLENLRLLCPNCHSQQPTSFGKNRGLA